MATTSTSAEKFNIRWINYTPVLQGVLRKLLIEEKFVDVTLACEGKSIKCHRIVLSACSAYFDKVLTENPSSHLVIFLQNTKVWELQALITFMYNGEVSANQKKLAGLVKAAEALKIKGLAPETPDEPVVEKDDDDEELDFKAMVNFKEDLENNEESLLKITAVAPVVVMAPKPFTVPKLVSASKPLSAPKPVSAPAPKPVHAPRAVLPLPPTLTQCPVLPPMGKSLLKRKGQAMPALPKLVKMQKVENVPHPLPKLYPQPQFNGNGGGAPTPSHPPTLTAERQPLPRSTKLNTTPFISAATTAKNQRIMDEDDTELHDLERAEMEDLYGDGEEFESIEEEEYKDVEDDMEMVEEVEGIDEDCDAASNECQTSGSENEDTASGSGYSAGGRKLRYKYGKEIRDSALGALNSGISLRQCSEAFGIPRKTLSKWKTQEVKCDALTDEAGEFDEALVRKPGIDAAERAQRLNQAMVLAMSGTTVRQAAAHFDIPRTTLCAYMKRRGVAPKRNFIPTPGGIPGLPLSKKTAIKPVGESSSAAVGSSNTINPNLPLPVIPNDDIGMGILDFIEDLNGEN